MNQKVSSSSWAKSSRAPSSWATAGRGQGSAGPTAGLPGLLARISGCRLCVDTPLKAPLPHEPRPVVRVGAGTARLLLCGQAPGTRVHASGLPFDDPSGTRLRDWLGLSPAEFYDEDRVAIVPMGFCFPGLDSHGADLPPRPECAATWHDGLFAALPEPDLIVALGLHAQRYHLRRLGRPDLLGPTLSAVVADWRRVLDETGLIPLPHPSWRNSGWLARHPWFVAELLPILRARVREAFAAATPPERRNP